MPKRPPKSDLGDGVQHRYPGIESRDNSGLLRLDVTRQRRAAASRRLASATRGRTDLGGGATSPYHP